MKFWTALQWPLAQAVLVDDGKIITSIPANPAQTPARHVATIGEFDGKLVVQRRACMELWSPDGKEQFKHIYHPWFYSVHAVQQYGNAMMVLSSGIDLIFLIDWEGKVLWEWWGWKKKLCMEPSFINQPDWPILQVSSNTLRSDNTMHLNSIYIKDDKIYSSAMQRKSVLEIDIKTGGYKAVLFTTQAPHRPVPHKDTYIYGDMSGLMLGDKRVLEDFRLWVKYIEIVNDGYIYSDQNSVTKIDNEFKEMWTVKLPAPFGVKLLKE